MSGCPASLRRDHRHLALHFVSTVSLSRKVISLNGVAVILGGQNGSRVSHASVYGEKQ